MNILALLRSRFEPALKSLIAAPAPLLEMIRVSQDAKFGDYQANFAMSLGKQLGKPPREVATEVAAQTALDDVCQPREVAGPGFINLRLRDDWLTAQLQAAVADPRLGVPLVAKPKTYVIDYSSPNVAKPMHVGHIRSTVIGDALDRTLRFLGHKVISDNHLGDWGTQFGMVIYGYKHFVDQAAYKTNPVKELSRLYRLVSSLVVYRESLAALPAAQQRMQDREAAIAQQEAAAKTGDKAADKKAAQSLAKLRTQLADDVEAVGELEKKIAAIEGDAALLALAQQHATIDQAVLAETAKLHTGDAENLRLWNQFLPHCRDEIQRVYQRLNIRFDHEYGESYYHEMLGAVVEELKRKNLARESDGALCVFLEGFETPMIVQKKDGAFLYSTTDLATIQYRLREWQPDGILYVVDHRQSEHFAKLFAAAKLLGYGEREFAHISFGTILGEDGRPYKTRSGTTVGLEGLLDEAVARALVIVATNDDAKPGGAELSPEERKNVAEVVGIGGLKYIDLMQNRTTDYIFSYDKMLATTGNTATYLQYSYARVRSIFRKGGTTPEGVRASGAKIQLTHPAERALGLMLLRFGEALDDVVFDYRPNLLTSYLFDLAKSYFTFYEACSVLKAETDELRDSRLLLSDLTARTIKQGLSLLGIQVVEKM